MKPGREALRGFTLVELIIVLTTVSIIAALVGIRFENLPQTRAYFAVRKMRSDARYAQLLALNTQKRTRIVFDAGTDQYQLEMESSPGVWINAADPATKGNYQVALNSGDFAGADITQTVFNSTSTVIFDAFGSPFDGLGNTLNEPAFAELNAKYRLQIRAHTGKADIVTL